MQKKIKASKQLGVIKHRLKNKLSHLTQLSQNKVKRLCL